MTWEVMLLSSADEQCVIITYTRIYTHNTSISVHFIHKHLVSSGEPGQRHWDSLEFLRQQKCVR